MSTVTPFPKPTRTKGDSAFYSSTEWRKLVVSHNPRGVSEFDWIVDHFRATGRLTEPDQERLFALTGLEVSRVRKIVLQQLRGYRKLPKYAKAADR